MNFSRSVSKSDKGRTSGGQKRVQRLTRAAQSHQRQVVADNVIDHAIDHVSPHSAEGVLNVDLIGFGVPLTGVFDISEKRQLAGRVAAVGHAANSVLKVLVQRHKTSGVAFDSGIGRFDPRVGSTGATGGAVGRQRLADRLPGTGPEVAGVAVAQVEVSARLIHRNGIKAQTREPAQRRRAEETVAAGVVGNDRSILGGAQVVAPGLGGIGAINHIFAIHIVKMAVLHMDSFIITDTQDRAKTANTLRRRHESCNGTIGITASQSSGQCCCRRGTETFLLFEFETSVHCGALQMLVVMAWSVGLCSDICHDPGFRLQSEIPKALFSASMGCPRKELFVHIRGCDRIGHAIDGRYLPAS